MVTASFDLSKACDIGSIPVELLKNYEPELSYILAELFGMCLRESCLPDCLKDSSVCMLGTVQQLKPDVIIPDLSCHAVMLILSFED